MVKLACHINDILQEYHYSNIYHIEKNSNCERIHLGLNKSHIDTILSLIAALTGPFYILYVLHTPRAKNEAGRYQSQELSYEEISYLLNRFKVFLEKDARHDIWIHSHITNTTIVYDRHNLIYLYGFTEKHIKAIVEKEVRKGNISIPYPHEHYYNAEYDNFETEIINEYQWIKTPLRDEDRQ